MGLDQVPFVTIINLKSKYAVSTPYPLILIANLFIYVNKKHVTKETFSYTNETETAPILAYVTNIANSTVAVITLYNSDCDITELKQDINCILANLISDIVDHYDG